MLQLAPTHYDYRETQTGTSAASDVPRFSAASDSSLHNKCELSRTRGGSAASPPRRGAGAAVSRAGGWWVTVTGTRRGRGRRRWCGASARGDEEGAPVREHRLVPIRGVLAPDLLADATHAHRVPTVLQA